MSKQKIIDKPMNELVKGEFDRLKEALCRQNLDSQTIENLIPLINNMAFQRIQLDEMIRDLTEQGLVTKYSNGKDQEGTHLNPCFTAYVKLWAAYSKALQDFARYFPDEITGAVTNNNVTPLLQVMEMKKKKSL